MVNAFKDKLIDAFPWAISDLERIARHPDFDAARLTRLAKESEVTSLLWLVADWMERTHDDHVWRGVRVLLGPRPPRPVYARLFQILLGKKTALSTSAFRVLVRMASDSPRRQALALASAAIFQTERWLEMGGR